MKNKIKNIFKILVVTAGCLMFASFSPSLDGRAVVVEEGVFPQGLFAKTVGYLPGDIISVTNIAGDKTIDLLVIGALDPSEGVAIMLSPEAAEAMGIDKGANNIVKITKRSGQDERVYGNAIISKSASEIEDWDDSNFENISAEENTEAFDEAKEEPETEAELEDEETFDEEESFEEEEADEGEAEEEEEEAFDDAAEEETEEEFEEPEEDAEEELEEDAEEEAFDEAIEEEEEESEEEAFEDEEEPAEEAFEDEAYEEEADAEEFDDETPDALEEKADEEAFEDEGLNELPAEESEETFESEELEPASEEFAEEAEEEAIEEPAEEESLEALEEEAPAEEAFDEEQLDEYEAIVLVPADSNPPENKVEEDEVEDIIAENEFTEIDEEITLTPLPSDTTKSVTPVTPVIKEDLGDKKFTPSSATSYDKYMVSSLKDLESGKYYIQIAVYASDDNILEVINKYGANYPITIVPMAGGNKKQVLVGPVTMDEYKVVLERFKSYGFKDAFLRKIR